MKIVQQVELSLVALILAACQAPPLPLTATAIPTRASATAVPPTQTPTAVSCGDLDAAWGQDWARTIDVLQVLEAQSASCGPEPLSSKTYAARVSYGASLEAAGDVDGATTQYQAAFALDPGRQEAWSALQRLGRLPDPTAAPCDPERESLAAYAPLDDSGSYVAAQGRQLQLGGALYSLRGLNYYPRHAPWRNFLTAADPAEMAAELDLIQQAGFNSLRVFLWYDVLFTCAPEDAVPVASTFERFETLLRLAHERGLRVMVTLNDLPDLVYRPLYTDWPRYDAQTAFIVSRYREEATILAWDLRNEGDLDYGGRSPLEARFSSSQVLDWLAHVATLVREADPHHLLTAGWWGDPVPTEAVVDVLSFHHWSDATQLQGRVGDYLARSTKPLLLQEVGYHSWATAPQDARDETTQAGLLQSVTSTADSAGLAGWMIWAAFDFDPPPGQAPTHEHFFGLWHSDLSPKPALESLPMP